MSDITKKVNKLDNISDVEFAKIAAALIGVEYPGDEYFEDGKARIVIREDNDTQSEDLVVASKETAPLSIDVINVETGERVRSLPFRKQSFSQWQSARLRNLAKVGILSLDKEDAMNSDSSGSQAVLDILLGKQTSLIEENSKSSSDDEFKVSELDSLEEILLMTSNESVDKNQTEDSKLQEDKDDSLSVDKILTIESDSEEEKLDEISVNERNDVIDSSYYVVPEVTVLEKKNRAKLRPPVMPEFIPEKSIYFAHIEIKPRRIRRTSNAPHIIPTHSEPIEFSPKGGKYREI